MRTAATLLFVGLLALAALNTKPSHCEAAEMATRIALSVDGTDTDIDRAERLIQLCEGY